MEIDPGIGWLLSSRDPSVRYFALTDLLGKTNRARAVQEAKAAIPRGPRVRALFAGQQPDGSFGKGPYSKWTGAHWRLVSLVELGIPSGHKRALKAADD